jgi:hypothetical protein
MMMLCQSSPKRLSFYFIEKGYDPGKDGTEAEQTGKDGERTYQQD